jgi:hypothetical protein
MSPSRVYPATSPWFNSVVVILMLAAAPLTLPALNVTVQVIGPALRLKPHARIAVTVDGQTLRGVKIAVWQGNNSSTIVDLITDEQGEVTLPDLPPGKYFIGSSPAQSPSFGGPLDVCIAPCPDDGLETIDLTQDSLRGSLHPIDRDAFALSEIRMEIGPRRDPSWAASLKTAEQHTMTSSVQTFHGVVHDQSGAVIPGAMIDVLVKGTEGKTHAALIRSDNSGKFSAELPSGDFVAMISSPGFQVQTFSFTIAASGSADDVQIVLIVGSETQTVTVGD